MLNSEEPAQGGGPGGADDLAGAGGLGGAGGPGGFQIQVTPEEKACIDRVCPINFLILFFF